MKNTDLHLKILLQKRKIPLLKILDLENKYKIVCLYLVQHLLHQIKAPQFYTDLDLQKQCWILLYMVKFKEFSRPLSF